MREGGIIAGNDHFIKKGNPVLMTDVEKGGGRDQFWRSFDDIIC